MVPHVGLTVLVHGVKSNGADVHPAIVTRVWSPGKDLDCGIVAVNVTVFPDNEQPIVRSSVPLCATREIACGCGAPLAAYLAG